MSGAAIAGAAVVGAGASIYSADKASSAADKQTAAADQAQAAQLEFQKEQYADWERIFGPIQDRLSAHYQSLNPDTYAALGLSSLQQSYTQSLENIDKNLAQRGISQSGIAAAAITGLEAQRMVAGTQIRQQAPEQVANQQLNFLSAGLGLQPQLQQGVASSYQNMANTASNAAVAYNNQAASSYAGVGQSIGAGINTYMTYNALNPAPVASPALPPASAGTWI